MLPRVSEPRSNTSGRSRNGTPRRRSERSGGSAPHLGAAVRHPIVKVPVQAAKILDAGHPWVFRDTVRRMPQGMSPGTLLHVHDDDGRPVGWGLVEPDGAVALRIVSLQKQFTWDDACLEARVRRAQDHRLRNLDPGVGSACRLLHGESDGFPGLAVDRLGDYLLVYKYSYVGESYLDRLVPILERVFEPRGIYMQDRIRAVNPQDRRPPAFHLAGVKAPPELEVEEDGLRYVVDVTAPVSPGLFLDLREGRRLCEQVASERAVLNLFSFTGSLALRALRGGARSVTNVDAAARSHARCRQNLALSNMDPEACETITGDAFKHLERMRARGREFDLVVVDPPPFSNVKGSTFTALQHWSELMEAVSRVTREGGLVLAISNASRLYEDEFLNALGAGSRAAGRTARIVAERALPCDFPVLPAFSEGRYLKIKLLQLP